MPPFTTSPAPPLLGTFSPLLTVLPVLSGGWLGSSGWPMAPTLLVIVGVLAIAGSTEEFVVATATALLVGDSARALVASWVAGVASVTFFSLHPAKRKAATNQRPKDSFMVKV